MECLFNNSCWFLLVIIIALISGCISQKENLHNLTDGSERFSKRTDMLQDIYKAYSFYRSQMTSKVVRDMVTTNPNISTTCATHLNMTVNGLSEMEIWAFLMLDAMGKPGPGIVGGNIHWTGAYQQCIDVRASQLTPVKGTNQSVITYPFNGRYCSVGINPIPEQYTSDIAAVTELMVFDLTIGVCVPDTCSADDIKALADNALNLLPSTPLLELHSDVICQQDIEYDAKAISFLVFIGVLVIVLCLGTAYDMIVVHKLHQSQVTHADNNEVTSLIRSQEDNGYNEGSLTNKYSGTDNGGDHNVRHIQETTTVSGKLVSILVSFSLYTNATKLLNTKQGAGELSAIHGIRVLSLSWVILGHTVAFMLTTPTLNCVPTMASYMEKFGFMTLANAGVSVDSFFCMSGLLTAYLVLKEMKKRGEVKKFPFGMFYLFRFWRLTPPLMLIIFMMATTSKYWSNGPYWNQNGLFSEECSKYWWTYALYINNFYKGNQQCVGWAWYLANDWQFYAISPLFIIPLYLNVYVGGFICLVVLVVTATLNGTFAYDHNMMLSFYGGGKITVGIDTFLKSMEDQYNVLYVQPHYRIGPYVVGMLAGYVLYKTDCKASMKRWINILGWIVAIGCCTAIVYGDYGTLSGKYDTDQHVIALYIALKRIVWSLSVGWIIYACASGYGGPINKLLSLSVFVPLGRMSYMAYLIHPMIMISYYTAKRSPIDCNLWDSLYYFIGNLVLSFVGGFITSLMFESPFVGLPKVFMKYKTA